MPQKTPTNHGFFSLLMSSSSLFKAKGPKGSNTWGPRPTRKFPPLSFQTLLVGKKWEKHEKKNAYTSISPSPIAKVSGNTVEMVYKWKLSHFKYVPSLKLTFSHLKIGWKWISLPTFKFQVEDGARFWCPWAAHHHRAPRHKRPNTLCWLHHGCLVRLP